MTHLVGERDSAAENSQFERAIAEGIGELAMKFAAVGGSFRGAAPELDGVVKISIGVVGGRHPGEGLGVIRIVIETLLGDGAELAVVSLLQQNSAVGREDESGSKKSEQKCGDAE
jgi:hypothetical protein